MDPWGITELGIVKTEDNDLQVSTPRSLDNIDWRCTPAIDISRNTINASIRWFSPDIKREQIKEQLTKPSHIEISNIRSMFWNPDPWGDSGLGVLRLNENHGFELTFIGAGLRRGRARISTKDGKVLIKWLSDAL